VSPDIDRANVALQKGARTHLRIGITFLALLGGLVSYRLVQPQPVSLGFYLFFGGLAAWALYSVRARYLEARCLRFTNHGLERRNQAGHWSLVPWGSVQRIDLGRTGFRVHADGHGVFSVRLSAARDLAAVASVFQAKLPEALSR
jgi:hypothetical protein